MTTANTPVKNGGKLSPVYNKHMIAMTKAMLLFEGALDKYRKDGENATMAKFKLAKERLMDLKKTMERCHAALPELEGEMEQAILAWFLVNRAVPFLKFWQEVIATVEGGSDLEIIAADVPMWFAPQ